MIIIPEKQMILITPPRTGSTALLSAVQLRHPNSMSLYRHMEADGVPAGYTSFRKIAIVRDPQDRMESLFSYCANLGSHSPWEAAMVNTTQLGFSTWLLQGSVPFTHPHWARGVWFNPRYYCLHIMPEQRKSQWWYARPDLGTEVVVLGSSAWSDVCNELDLEVPRLNASPRLLLKWTLPMFQHLQEHHSWDLLTTKGARTYRLPAL